MNATIFLRTGHVESLSSGTCLISLKGDYKSPEEAFQAFLELLRAFTNEKTGYKSGNDCCQGVTQPYCSVCGKSTSRLDRRGEFLADYINSLTQCISDDDSSQLWEWLSNAGMEIVSIPDRKSHWIGIEEDAELVIPSLLGWETEMGRKISPEKSVLFMEGFNE